MIEIYRKRGSTVRYENGTTIRVRESGEAVDDGAVFRCAPLRSPALPEMDDHAVNSAVDAIRGASGNLRLERLIVTDGHVEHAMDRRLWQERHQRLHLSLVRGLHRLLIDEGTLDAAEVAAIAQSFANIGLEREAPVRLKLAPRVVAALTRTLLGALPPNLRMEQVAGGFDGKGQAVAASAGPAWPNWYRPSYRVRPVRAALNVAIRSDVTAFEEGLPEAIAILAPPEGASFRALIADGEAAYPASVRIVRFDAVTDPVRWFPYGAGVWAGAAAVVT